MTSKFVYVTYINTTPAKLWDAITRPEFSRQYWLGAVLDTDWKVGSPWKLVFADGTVADGGEVLENEPPKRLVLKWRNEFRPELKEEGFARCTFELAEEGGTVKLTVTHEIERDNSRLIMAVSGGWPKILSGLKTLLETGAPMPAPEKPEAQAARRRAAQNAA